MQPTYARLAQGHHGVHPWHNKQNPVAYRSPYAPKYTVPTHYGGISANGLLKFGLGAAFWGTVAGAGALLFFADVPRVRKDIMQKLPLIGDMFVKEVPPSDNPF